MISQRLKDKLKTLPSKPGVYFHKDKTGEVIYVGKAAVLKNRVRQYFRNNHDFDSKTKALVDEIDDTDWIETESELDALFLESEMIKRYMPRYNILLRDDKSQIYIRIDIKSEWPYLSYTRVPLDDSAEYIGPYYNAYPLKKAMRYLRRTFPYYTKAPRPGERPSLDAHIGLEPLDMTSDEYHRELNTMIQYIKGQRVGLIKEMERDMHQAASVQNFEQAAKLRNRVQNLKALKHRIMFGDKEFINLSKDKALADLKYLLMLPKPPQRIEGFDIAHMNGADVVASQVVFVNGVSSRSDYRKYKTRLERNDDYANMREVIGRRFSGRHSNWPTPDLLLIDGGKGQLDSAIQAMEQLNMHVPVISIAKADEEIVLHRSRSNIDTTQLDHLITHPQPSVAVMKDGDFLIINLHVGQLNTSSHSKNLHGSDRVNMYDDVVKLFQRIRDESHRFAVSYHNVLKRKHQTENLLETIPGVGAMTRRKLIRQFGSLNGVASAAEIEIAQIVGESKAHIIKQYLNH